MVGPEALLFLWRGYADPAPRVRPAPRFDYARGLVAANACALPFAKLATRRVVGPNDGSAASRSPCFSPSAGTPPRLTRDRPAVLLRFSERSLGQKLKPLLVATCATGRLAGHPGVVGDLAADPLCRGCESRRGACRRPDPRRPASACRCRSPGPAVTGSRRPGCCYRDEWPWRVRRPSAPAFTDNQAQSEGPCNDGIVARAFRRRRRRRRGPPPSCRTDR